MEVAEPRGIHRRLEINVTDSLRVRFNSHVQRTEGPACWPWQGALRNGYGAIKHEGKCHSAHKISFVLHNGPIPEGMLVTHSCDNRMCVNPVHLVAGTPQKNVLDMHEHGTHQTARGQAVGTATHSEDDVRRVKAMRIVTGNGARLIARATGFTESFVRDILGGVSWRHVVVATRAEAHAILTPAHLKGPTK